MLQSLNVIMVIKRLIFLLRFLRIDRRDPSVCDLDPALSVTPGYIYDLSVFPAALETFVIHVQSRDHLLTCRELSRWPGPDFTNIALSQITARVCLTGADWLPLTRQPISARKTDQFYVAVCSNRVESRGNQFKSRIDLSIYLHTHLTAKAR